MVAAVDRPPSLVSYSCKSAELGEAGDSGESGLLGESGESGLLGESGESGLAGDVAGGCIRCRGRSLAVPLHLLIAPVRPP